MVNDSEIEIETLKEKVIAIGRAPHHVAIIMDGNGRWAEKRGLSVKEGHSEGVKAVKRILIIARELGIKVLTLYTFSKQNWRRSFQEIGALMRLLSDSAYREIDELVENGVKLIVSGDLKGLPIAQREAMKMVMRRTARGDIITLNLALNYGGREEIIDAMKKIAKKIGKGEIKPDEINAELIEENIYTAGLPDPDLVIRTGGELRVSNFLLWQSAYSEFYFTETLWPDFDETEFCEALLDFASRERRFGGRNPT